MTIAEAARIMKKANSFVRMGLREGRLPFGTAIMTVQPTKDNPRGKWDYHISDEAFNHYMKYGKVPISKKEDV